uniref:Core protein VP4 n=1 Tax=Corriparta virus TaxID=40053 RepID=A0A8E8PI52_9REOV|nr:capping enzyme [Corriparta virus]
MAHTVLHLSERLAPISEDLFLPTWHIKKNADLNQLWLENGRYHSDVYAVGDLSNLTLRQLRGHNFIFIVHKRDRTFAKDGEVPRDIEIDDMQLKSSSFPPPKQLERLIGHGRMALRRQFGNIVRKYALNYASEFNGSEVETVMQVDFHRHKVYGLPELPPAIGLSKSRTDPYDNDKGTDEKLVSMLDYAVMSADVVYYVGCGDTRTIKIFSRQDPKRFSRVTWICIDPIAPKSWHRNMICVNSKITSPKDLRDLKMKEGGESMLLWDVRSDRGDMSEWEWEDLCEEQDALGDLVAMRNSDWLSLSIIKRRIPKHSNSCRLWTSILIPQPGAPDDMYELRNVIRGKGFSWIDRSHIPEPTERSVSSTSMRGLVLFHGKHRGKKLKISLIEYLHIVRRDGLSVVSEESAHLFYLTNGFNKGRDLAISEVVKAAEISTLWIGKNTPTGYDDFSWDTRDVMMRFSNDKTCVLDGNGFVLFLMWQWDQKVKYQKYDPFWAENFAVIFRRRVKHEPVPDVSLCRFIGIRTESSLLRIRTDMIHHAPDVLKDMGLDLSGHLYVSLATGRYCSDLTWWFDMILKWSCLERQEKVKMLQDSGAEVIEWKKDKEGEPWHILPDLIAALRQAEIQKFGASACLYRRWVQHLRAIQ